MIAIYKPNSKNTGTALSFNVNGGAVYLNLIKQSFWDPNTKKGSFSVLYVRPTCSQFIEFGSTPIKSLCIFSFIP